MDGMRISGDSDFWHREGMYEEDSGQITARPTLESIKISTTGTAGTMRKAEITFKVYSFRQLQDAQLSFFIPGVSCTVLWGWTITQDGTPVNTNPDLGIKDGDVEVHNIYEKLSTWTSDNAGCVDGMVGVISNFEWSRAADGGAASGTAIECNITVESPAKAFLEQSASPPTGKDCGCTEGGEDNDAEEDKVKGGWVKQAIKDQAKFSMDQLGSGTLWKNGDKILGVSFSFDQKHEKDPDDNWFQNFGKWFSTDILGNPQKNHYVTYDWFESICITSGLSTEGEAWKKGDSDGLGKFINEKSVQADGRFSNRIWFLNSAGVKLGRPDDMTMFCSTNPFVCIIPGYYHWKVSGVENPSETTMLFWRDMSDTDGLDQLPQWDGDIGKVMVNCNFIWDCYLESDTIADFIMKVVNGINDACGNWWDFKIVEDPSKPSHLQVIDVKSMTKLGESPQLDMGSTTSIARTWGMSTDIPDALKHSIMMGVHSKAPENNEDAGQNTDEPTRVWQVYGQAVTDKVYGGLKQPQKCDPEETDEKCPKDRKNNGAKTSIEDYADDLKAACKDLLNNVKEENIDSAASAMKAYWNKKQDVARAGQDIAIPIGFDCTLDGYGLFRWGMAFTVRQIDEEGILPTGYRFSISNIKQEVKRLDWTVSLETVLAMPDKIDVTAEISARPEAKEIAIIEESPTNVQVYNDEPFQPVENEEAEDPELKFKIPTADGSWLVRNDEGGDGKWQAPRGGRPHKGIDLVSNIGDQIKAPIDGKVKLTAAEIGGMPGTKIIGTGDFEGYIAYLFYASPNSGMINKTVQKGDVVATQDDLSIDYPEDVTDHLHLAIKKGDEHLDPSQGGDLNWEA
jgi:murein DD-endopeptidase MepM/ murein hydrolase activator NlpD